MQLNCASDLTPRPNDLQRLQSSKVMFSDISFSDNHVCVDKFECQKLNFRLNKSKVAVPHFWVLPIKTELVARKGAPATLYLEILRLHLDGDDDGNGDDDDVGNDDDDGNAGDLYIIQVFFLTGAPLKVLSVRFHGKSHKKKF